MTLARRTQNNGRDMWFKIYYILTYPLTLVFLFLIFIYRKILTHGKGKCCHFIPTCSAYAWESIREFGAIWGGALAFKRFHCLIQFIY